MSNTKSTLAGANVIVTEASKFLANFLGLVGAAAPQVAIAVTAVKAFIRWLHRDRDPDAPPLTPEQEAAIIAECADSVQRQLAVDDVFIERLKAQAAGAPSAPETDGGTLTGNFTTD